MLEKSHGSTYDAGRCPSSDYTCLCLSQRPPLIPLRDFFRNPEKTNYQLSPDGKYLSYLAPFQNRLNIFIQEHRHIQKTRNGSPLLLKGISRIFLEGPRYPHLFDGQ